jgi:hypothetical protein
MPASLCHRPENLAARVVEDAFHMSTEITASISASLKHLARFCQTRWERSTLTHVHIQ